MRQKALKPTCSAQEPRHEVPAASPLSPDLDNGIELLVVSAVESDLNSLRGILEPIRASLRFSATRAHALELLRAGSIGVVISNAELPDGTWRDFIDPIAVLTPPPDLIVCSRLADERLWAEVLNLGGYDVLAIPFHAGEVEYAVNAACRTYRSKLAAEQARRRPAGSERRATGGKP